MTELWKAFIARLVCWLTPRPPAPVIVQSPEPPLKPGICECGHVRCCHENGRGKCHAQYPPDDEWKNGACCACLLFIPGNDAGNGDPATPSPEELERIYQK